MMVPEEWPSRAGASPCHTEPGLQADWRLILNVYGKGLILPIYCLSPARRIAQTEEITNEKNDDYPGYGRCHSTFRL